MDDNQMDESEDVSQNKRLAEMSLSAGEAAGSKEQSQDCGEQGHRGNGSVNVMLDAGTPEEGQEKMEEDDPEGIKKSLQKGYKAVKKFFTGSPEKDKGDNHNSIHTYVRQPPIPVKDDSDTYDFTHSKRGKAIIINNDKFMTLSGLGSRPGSDKDAADLKEMFKKLGFDAERHDNLKGFEMKEVLEKGARLYNHDAADCLAVAILSHGDSEVQDKSRDYFYNKAHPDSDRAKRDLIYGTDGSYISTASVIRTFQDERCPGLVGKPRLFFLQACRGSSYDDGVDVAVTPDEVERPGDDDEVDDDTNTETTDARGSRPARPLRPAARRNMTSPAPIFKDFLVMYATTPGHFAWRRSTGTWFVQSLSAVMTRQLTPSMSLTQALTHVTRMVAQGYQSQSSKANYHGKKQVPVIESMLVKDIYFTDK